MNKLLKIIFGKVRGNIFSIIYKQPDYWFYVRELARITEISASGIGKDLRQLYLSGIVERKKSGTMLMYRCNRGSPIFMELQSLIRRVG